MKLVNVTDLKTKFAEILQLAGQEDIIITYHGKAKAILKPLNEDDWEDYVLVNHPGFIAQRETARVDEAAGRVVDIDTLLKETEDAEI
jgi:antitoxin (DNA-binding transcriptional repressor) of toxin-antitoxin stability system